MVEQRSPKPLMRVRFLLLLPNRNYLSNKWLRLFCNFSFLKANAKCITLIAYTLATKPKKSNFAAKGTAFKQINKKI